MSASKKKASKPGGKATKGSWAKTMQTALEKKRPAGGWPAQAKPRDSGVPKVKKNSF